MAVGALIGYGVQVAENREAGMSWGDALTTDISGETIFKGAVIGGGVAVGGVAVVTIASIGAPALGIGATAACADGDCTNEVNAVVNAVSADGNPTNEINTGTNVVYEGWNNGQRYIGITKNFASRFNYWRRNGMYVSPLEGLENLNRFDARAAERYLINYYGLSNLANKINSISTTNPIYTEAIKRAEQIMKTIENIR